jgi:hypothetical protein
MEGRRSESQPCSWMGRGSIDARRGAPSARLGLGGFREYPHVLFLEPIVRRLQALGWVVRISAKPQSQTLALARARGMEVDRVGSGDLIGRTEKVLGGLSRATQLARWAGRQERPAILVCSSRTAGLAARASRSGDWIAGLRTRGASPSRSPAEVFGCPTFCVRCVSQDPFAA